MMDTPIRLTITSPYIRGGDLEITVDGFADAERSAAALRWWGCLVKAALVREELEPFDLDPFEVDVEPPKGVPDAS